MGTVRGAPRAPLLAVVAGTLLLAVPCPAAACINGVIYRVDPEVIRLRRAERLVVARKYGAALRLVATHAFRHPARARRARLIDAVARTRMLAESGPVDSLLLRYPLAVLRDMYEEDPVSPRVRARLAEALLLLPDGADEARKLVEPLAVHDVVPDAEGWATVAGVRAAAGDQVGAAVAMERCVTRADDRHVCRAPGRTS